MARKLIIMVLAVLLGGAAVAQSEEPAGTGDEIYTVVEQNPEFPGGMDALLQWLGTHVEYPEEARSQGLEGKVYVTFVVERDGSISNVRVISPKETLAPLNEEAVRVVKSMPRWKPGKQRGKRVRVQFNLPIQFAL